MKMIRGSPLLLTKPMHPKSTKKSATWCQHDTDIEDVRDEEKIREILCSSSETGAAKDAFVKLGGRGIEGTGRGGSPTGRGGTK